MKDKNSNSLLEADSAVEQYLDLLLQHATESESTEKPVDTLNNIVLMPELQLPDDSGTQPEVEKERQDTDQIVESPVTVEVEAADTEEPETSERMTGQLAYEFPLQCLMFKVGGATLSVPLIDMGSVLPRSDNLTYLPQSPLWLLGILQHRGSNVKVVDSARLLKLPDSNDKAPTKHFIVFAGEEWAISCDELGDVVNLDEQDIQWSGQAGSGFSIGTIKQSLAQLLDPARIQRKLNQLEKT
jgi:chemotaxis signal transduction protein